MSMVQTVQSLTLAGYTRQTSEKPLFLLHAMISFGLHLVQMYHLRIDLSSLFCFFYPSACNK